MDLPMLKDWAKANCQDLDISRRKKPETAIEAILEHLEKHPLQPQDDSN